MKLRFFRFYPRLVLVLVLMYFAGPYRDNPDGSQSENRAGAGALLTVKPVMAIAERTLSNLSTAPKLVT